MYDIQRVSWTRNDLGVIVQSRTETSSSTWETGCTFRLIRNNNEDVDGLRCPYFTKIHIHEQVLHCTWNSSDGCWMSTCKHSTRSYSDTIMLIQHPLFTWTGETLEFTNCVVNANNFSVVKRLKTYDYTASLTFKLQGVACFNSHSSWHGFTGVVDHFVISESNIEFLKLPHVFQKRLSRTHGGWKNRRLNYGWKQRPVWRPTCGSPDSAHPRALTSSGCQSLCSLRLFQIIVT